MLTFSRKKRIHVPGGNLRPESPLYRYNNQRCARVSARGKTWEEGDLCTGWGLPFAWCAG